MSRSKTRRFYFAGDGKRPLQPDDDDEEEESRIRADEVNRRTREYMASAVDRGHKTVNIGQGIDIRTRMQLLEHVEDQLPAPEDRVDQYVLFSRLPSSSSSSSSSSASSSSYIPFPSEGGPRIHSHEKIAYTLEEVPAFVVDDDMYAQMRNYPRQDVVQRLAQGEYTPNVCNNAGECLPAHLMSNFMKETEDFIILKGLLSYGLDPRSPVDGHTSLYPMFQKPYQYDHFHNERLNILRNLFTLFPDLKDELHFTHGHAGFTVLEEAITNDYPFPYIKLLVEQGAPLTKRVVTKALRRFYARNDEQSEMIVDLIHDSPGVWRPNAVDGVALFNQLEMLVPYQHRSAWAPLREKWTGLHVMSEAQVAEYGLRRQKSNLDPDWTCPICQESDQEDVVWTVPCGHEFHKTCLQAALRAMHNERCPMCRTQVEGVTQFNTQSRSSSSSFGRARRSRLRRSAPKKSMRRARK